MRQTSSDKVFDALLRQAVRDFAIQEAERVPPREELEKMYTITPKVDAKIRKLCEKADRQSTRSHVFAGLRKAAVIALIVFSVIGGAFILNPSVRAAVSEVIVEWFEQFTKFVGLSQPDERIDWELGFVPEGFTEDDRYEGDITQITYLNDVGQLFYFQYAFSNDSFSIDNEGSSYEVNMQGEHAFYIFIAEDGAETNKIVWHKDGYGFSISGNLNISTLKSIALSVKST